MPLIVVDFRAVPEAAAEEAAALGVLLAALGVLAVPDGEEDPHAAATRATPARPAGTNHRLRMTYPRLQKRDVLLPSTYPGAGPFNGLLRESRGGLDRAP
jgi:hypothetical protein